MERYEPCNSSKQTNPDTGAEFEVGSIYWVYLSVGWLVGWLVGWYHDDEGKHVITASTLAQVKE